MSDTLDTARTDWPRALRALRRLIADSERTEEVFELIDAMAGPSGLRRFEAFRDDPAGRTLLERKPCLLTTLSNREALRRLPEGSFGRAYADFMDGADLSADGLLEASELGNDQTAAASVGDPDLEWWGCRLRDSHDLWHVLSGYGRDEAGEVALLAFTHAQTGNRAIAMIVLVGAAVGLAQGGLGWPGYLLRARRRGKAARRLQFAPYEDWLARPLADVRADLGIEPPEVAHPTGIAVGNRGDEAELVQA